MARPPPVPPGKLTSEEYLLWAEAQQRGRFELVAGEVFALAPERIGHTRVKAHTWLALSNAINAARVDAEAFPGGLAVRVDGGTVYGPDALVNLGGRVDGDAVVAPRPGIVVEVVTPASGVVDTSLKLADYFRVPSIRHYLIVLAESRAVVHHTRRGGGAIETRIVASGRVELGPPSIAITVEELFGD